MSYTISEVAEMMGVAPSTIRYYEKEGLLPNVRRKNGIRVFEEEDFKWLRLLNCLKNTGMPIRRIRQYVELTEAGDATLQERYDLIKEQRQSVLDQVEQLNYYLHELDYKDWYYRKALELGSEAAVQELTAKNPAKGFEVDEIPDGAGGDGGSAGAASDGKPDGSAGLAAAGNADAERQP